MGGLIQADKYTTNITAQAAIPDAKKGPGQARGTLCTIAVLASAAAAGTIYDANATGNATAAKAIAPIPAAVGVYPCEIPFFDGLVVTPGAGQTVCVSYQ